MRVGYALLLTCSVLASTASAHGPTLHAARITRAFRHDAAAKMWMSDNGGYIWQLDSKGGVVGALTDCHGPEGIKVDHARNLWAVCNGATTIQEYAPGATSASLVLNDSPGFFPNDVATDPTGNVYAVNTDGFICHGSSCTSYPGNVVYWLSAHLHSGATPDGMVADPNMYQGFFLDTDAAGNVYVDMLNESADRGETDEIADPLGSNPTITNLKINPSYPGGVYVSNGGTVLNVVDQLRRTISRYTLPSGPPLHHLGPLPENYEKSCNPIGLGFSLNDSDVAVADVACRALDRGIVVSNRFTALVSNSFLAPVTAAFTVSDK